MPQTCSPEAAPLPIAPADNGLAPVLDTEDFSAWETAVASTLALAVGGRGRACPISHPTGR